MIDQLPFFSVQNCTEDRFDFLCPMFWSKLIKTDDENVRSCLVCKKNVHLCKTDAELKQHVEAGHCVAVDNTEKNNARRDAEIAEIRRSRAKIYVGYIAPKK